ncbi:MAG: DUF4249 domain-containing protein [Chitinophagaceae bacterium]
MIDRYTLLDKVFVRLFRNLSQLAKPHCLILFILMAVFFSSCQKVIDVGIKNVEKKYVIEAVVTDQPDSSKVLISTTKNVSENNNFPGISGATVTVTDNAGIVTTFTEDSAGYYYAHSFKGVIGKTYTLRVIVNSETFTASSTMPPIVSMDTLYITDELLFGETRKLSNTTYQDPPGKGNCYRYVQYINGKKGKTIFTNNDDYTDGKYVEAKLWYLADDDEEDQKIKSGDSVRLDLFCIDPAVFKYWFSLNQSATGNSQSASPANAVTNITGGALGYFSAHTVQSKTIVAP